MPCKIMYKEVESYIAVTKKRHKKSRIKAGGLK